MVTIAEEAYLPDWDDLRRYPPSVLVERLRRRLFAQFVHSTQAEAPELRNMISRVGKGIMFGESNPDIRDLAHEDF